MSPGLSLPPATSDHGANEPPHAPTTSFDLGGLRGASMRWNQVGSLPSLARVQESDVPAQQRRLRHLSSISIRNLTLALAPPPPPPPPPHGHAHSPRTSNLAAETPRSVDDTDLLLRSQGRPRAGTDASIHTFSSSSSADCSSASHDPSPGPSHSPPRRPSLVKRKAPPSARPCPAVEAPPNAAQPDRPRRRSHLDAPRERLPPIPAYRSKRPHPGASSGAGRLGFGLGLVIQAGSAATRERWEETIQARMVDSCVCVRAVGSGGGGRGAPGREQGTAGVVWVSKVAESTMDPTFYVDAQSGVVEPHAGWTRGSGVEISLWVRVTKAAVRGRAGDTNGAGRHDRPPERGFARALEWRVDFANLISVGRDLTSLDSHDTPNTLILCLSDEYFLIPASSPPASLADRFSNVGRGRAIEPDDDLSYLSDPEADRALIRARTKANEAERRKREQGQVAERSVKETRMVASYDSEGLYGTVRRQRELDEVNDELLHYREQAREWLESLKGRPSRREISQTHHRLEVLDQDIAASHRNLGETRALLAQRRAALDARRCTLTVARDHLAALRVERSGEQALLAASRNQAAAVAARLAARRSQIARVLSSVYSIASVTPSTLLFSINSVPLPNSAFDYAKVDEAGESAALGWVAEVVRLIAGYLGVCLIYPVSVMGARSFIIDPVSLMKGPRAFPLYAKGVDRYRFDYGVFLLNKNIEQIMHCRKLLALDLRHTLPNLKNLLLTLDMEPAPPPELLSDASPIASAPVEPSLPDPPPPASPAPPPPPAAATDGAPMDTDVPTEPERCSSPAPTLKTSRSRASTRSEKTVTGAAAASDGSATPPGSVVAHGQGAGRRVNSAA